MLVAARHTCLEPHYVVIECQHAQANHQKVGGVRKRVKQLGGDVEWREVPGGGISCRVCIRQLSEKR
jgi:hypothetical protein